MESEFKLNESIQLVVIKPLTFDLTLRFTLYLNAVKQVEIIHMMQIGQMAKKLGVKADTLRFYEKNGLLQPSTRSETGYRYYSDSDFQRAMFILRCKRVGFTLADIKELLSIRIDKSNHSCEQVKNRTTAKRIEVEERIAELQRFHRSLTQLEKACRGGPGSAESCSILESLEHQQQESYDVA